MSDNKISPTITLRQTSLSKVLKKLEKGDFAEVKHLVSSEDKVINDDVSVIALTHGTTPEAKTFALTDRNGNQFIYTTTNYHAVTKFKEAKGKLQHFAGRCAGCHSDRPILEWYCAFEIKKEAKNGKIVTLLYYDRRCCDDECALLFLNRLTKSDPYYEQRILLFKMVFNMVLPDATPKAADDPSLLKCNEGALTWEEYKSKRLAISYKLTPNVYFVPASLVYNAITSTD